MEKKKKTKVPGTQARGRARLQRRQRKANSPGLGPGGPFWFLTLLVLGGEQVAVSGSDVMQKGQDWLGLRGSGSVTWVGLQVASDACQPLVRTNTHQFTFPRAQGYTR